MKYLILSAVILGLASTGAAQKPHMTERGREKVFAGIHLTRAQKAQVDTIWTAHERETQPDRERMRTTPRDSMAEAAHDQKHTEMMDQLRAVLTPQQQVVFDRNRAKIEARRNQRRTPAPQNERPRTDRPKD